MITVKTAANITYSGFTYNTPVIVEYKHTGKQYFKSKHHFTESEEIAQRWKEEGKKVTTKDGHYFINRIAIPTINAKGEKDVWYITNAGDTYKVNKVSKYWDKIHKLLSSNINPFIN